MEVIRQGSTWVGPARVLEELQCLPVLDARCPRHDQPPIDEHGVLVIDRRDAAVRVGERDVKAMPVFSSHVPSMKPIVVASEQFRQYTPVTRVPRITNS